MEGYYLYKKCAQCDNTDYFVLTKVQAAFGQYPVADTIKAPCSSCGSVKFFATGSNQPDADKELLDIWGYDESLHFSDQDEEIILADIKYLNLFLDAIDNSSYLQLKKDGLLAALCILYYDNAANSEEYTDKDNALRKAIADAVLPYLKQREALIKNIPGWMLWEYITDIVYPAIGLPLNMSKEKHYLITNQLAWDAKTAHHVASDFYDMPGFLAGKNTLNQIELELLGDVRGKTVLHLQCHFGQDTLSFSRMGAIATGVDFSEAAVDKGRELAAQLGLDTKFICCDVYSLPDVLNQQFDIVFTSYGTIGWLPDVDKWAAVVSKFLKPDGKFVFAEFHPVIWMFDNDFTKVTYNYFKDEAIIEEETGTYAEKEADLRNETISWNHSISEVLGGLLNHGLTLEKFNEYDYSPYSCFSHLEEFEPGKFRVKHLGNNIPMVYSILATKK